MLKKNCWIISQNFQCMCAGFLCPKCDNFACLHTRQDQNELHLERRFLFGENGIFCKSIAGPLSESYTHPYSFGGRIKLINCQIRHELSVTIHEINNSWKNVRWRTLYSHINFNVEHFTTKLNEFKTWLRCPLKFFFLCIFFFFFNFSSFFVVTGN